MTKSPDTDRDTLTQKVYATDETLAVRQRTHELYSIPKINYTEWVLDRVTWRGDEQVLDIGAGPGAYFGDIVAHIPNGLLVAGDLSLGMARRAARQGKAGLLTNTDTQALPFRDETFDVILANHMLYHLPDLNEGLSEIHRVLKLTGCLIAATNSRYNLPEFETFTRRAYHLLGATGPDSEPSRPISNHFDLEGGLGHLAKHFFAVARCDLPGALVFPTVEPALEYINSMRTLRESVLPRHVSWDDYLSVMSDQFKRWIAHYGELVVSKLSGVFVATDGGAFIRNYIALQNQETRDSR